MQLIKCTTISNSISTERPNPTGHFNSGTLVFLTQQTADHTCVKVWKYGSTLDLKNSSTTSSISAQHLGRKCSCVWPANK